MYTTLLHCDQTNGVTKSLAAAKAKPGKTHIAERPDEIHTHEALRNRDLETEYSANIAYNFNTDNIKIKSQVKEALVISTI